MLILIIRIKPPLKQYAVRTRLEFNGADFVRKRINDLKNPTFNVTKPGKRFINQGTCLWNDGVQRKIRDKKRICHKFVVSKTRQLANSQGSQPKSKNLYNKQDTRDTGY